MVVRTCTLPKYLATSLAIQITPQILRNVLMKPDRPCLHFMPIKILEVHPDKAINPTQDLADKSVYQFAATYRGIPCISS